MKAMRARPQVSVELVAGGLARDGEYAVLEVRAPAGATLPPHVSSRQDGVLLVLHGELEVVVGDERRILADGEAVGLPRSKPRRVEVLTDVRLLCLTAPAGLERLVDAVTEPELDRDDLAALLTVAGVAVLPVGWGGAISGAILGWFPMARPSGRSEAGHMTTRAHIPFRTTASAVLATAACAIAAGPAQAVVGGANGPIAFERSETVFLQAPGGDATALTAANDMNHNPAISPDGASVAYVHNRDIWVMRADGEGKRRLTTDRNYNDAPAWSPDGSRIAFVAGAGGGADLHVIAAEGGAAQPLTSTPGHQERHPAWSPDGSRIAYDRTGCETPGGGGTCVYVMPAQGGAPVNLTPETRLAGCESQPAFRFHGSSSEPAWSPDGSQIVFTGPTICSISSRGTDLWVMSGTGNAKTNLNRDAETNDGKAAFSPDGAQIVFVTTRAGEQSTLSTMAANGAAPTTTAGGGAMHPDWGVAAPAPPPDGGPEPTPGPPTSPPPTSPTPVEPRPEPPVTRPDPPANRCVVPNVKGRKLAAAKRLIVQRGCRLGPVTRRRSPKGVKGRILGQRPRPGARRRAGARVPLVVGAGPLRR